MPRTRKNHPRSQKCMFSFGPADLPVNSCLTGNPRTRSITGGLRRDRKNKDKPSSVINAWTSRRADEETQVPLDHGGKAFKNIVAHAHQVSTCVARPTAVAKDGTRRSRPSRPILSALKKRSISISTVQRDLRTYFGPLIRYRNQYRRLYACQQRTNGLFKAMPEHSPPPRPLYPAVSIG